MIALRCSVDGCNAAISVPEQRVENLTARGAWTCQSCRVAHSLVACHYCHRTADACSRIPGRCCGSCDHPKENR